MVTSPTVFILGIASDIGRELGLRFAQAGWQVTGTFRNSDHAKDLPKEWLLFQCDMLCKEQIERLVVKCQQIELRWDIWISAVGVLDPIGSFFQVSFNQWEESIQTNALAPLRVLHALHERRRENSISSVAFFAGAGTNGPATNYSAYCASKIFLIKMTELLDDENADLNVFIIGPGMVKTRIHEQTLLAKARAGSNLAKVERFLEDSNAGVGHNEIFDCFLWCHSAGKKVISGRNISLVYDDWRNGGNQLSAQLRDNPEAYKLRRFSSLGYHEVEKQGNRGEEKIKAPFVPGV